MNQDISNRVRELFVDLSMKRYDSLADKVEVIRVLNDSFDPEGKSVLEDLIVNQVLQRDDQRQYGIMLSYSLRLSSAEDYLLQLLPCDETNRPLLILALGRIKSKKVYEQIERYLPAYKHQVLQALAMIDYEKTLPLIKKEIESLPDKSSYELISCIFMNMLEDDDYHLIVQKITKLKSDDKLKNQALVRIFAEAAHFSHVDTSQYSTITKSLLN